MIAYLISMSESGVCYEPASVRVLIVSFLVFAAACSNNPPGGKDAGDDAGLSDSGGGAGGGGGSGGGGVNPDEKCALSALQCAAGSECLTLLLGDGGLGTDCLPGACDLVRQDCDAGLKCTYVPADGGAGALVRGCAPDGTANEGEPCGPTTISNTCKAGLLCIAGDGGSSCVRFCNTTSECTNRLCNQTLSVPGSLEKPLLCGSAGCDILTQTCAGAGEACYPQGSGGACFTAGANNDGDACTFSNDCKKGSTCAGSSSPVCKQLCQFPSGAPACASGACVRLSTQTNVGVCQ